ncbi:tyrosine protein phosphatase [Phytohabitans sp. ZYX-F-186]|uniref:Tyrosine protein phosphatase n=1 Tax=Phytohabitans maris TaxID=3071409 RepID=A0ABU0ZQ49_9ACTN|nr:tyrosine protein phosphatase [Phytohabitans sp. ZYX-F-186]MDQ7909130.1 tyrosine protein phosphatase [Phytohabitans sp. ZYX-F-186]
MRPTLHVIEWHGPGRLATMSHPRGGDWLADEMSALVDADVDVLVSALTSEESDRLALSQEREAARAAGIIFVPFPIPDRGVPEPGPAAIELAIRLAAHVRAGRFVVTHCFAGIGRATLLAAATLVTLGARPAHALHLIATARGVHVPDTDAQRRWLFDFAAAHACYRERAWPGRLVAPQPRRPARASATVSGAGHQ